MNNKRAKGWILCPSKSFPGHFYYFNLSTGAVHWSLSDDQKNSIKKDIQKADDSHSYPEPSSPLEKTNNLKNIFVEKEKHKSTSPQALFPQIGSHQYISNVIFTPKRLTLQKPPYYSELPTFGKVTFPKYLSVSKMESVTRKNNFGQATESKSRYKLNSSQIRNKFDTTHQRICKSNVHNKRKNMTNLLKEPILKKNIVDNYVLCSNQIQNNSMYRNPFALKQSENHLCIKGGINSTICKSVGTQTSSNAITENSLQYTLQSREFQKNKPNVNFFQNNSFSSQSLSSLESEENCPLHTDESNNLIMKRIDRSEHIFQRNCTEADNNSDDYQNLPMDIETDNLEQINIISNDNIKINTNRLIDRSPKSHEMPVSNKNTDNTTPDKYLHTFREYNKKNQASIFYFENEINMLRKDTFKVEDEICAAIKNKVYIREETDQEREFNERNISYNTCLEEQDLIGQVQFGESNPELNRMYVEHPDYEKDQNIFMKEGTRDMLAGNDLRYVLEAKQRAKKVETVSNKIVENNKKHVTFDLDGNSIHEYENNYRKNLSNTRNSFTLKDLEAIQIEIKNNLKEDENIFKDTSTYEANISSYPSNIETSIKSHINNGYDEVCRMRVDRNDTHQIIPNSNFSNYQLTNFEDEYGRYLNSNSNFEFENEHRVCNLDYSLNRFDVDCDEIEQRVKLRVDEWVCCFTQIMEDFLEDVVKQSSIRLNPPPPWAFDEILTCIRTIYIENTKITTIVDRIIALFRVIQFRDHKLKSNLKASCVTKMIGGGMLLLESFEAILPNYNPDAYQKVSNLLRCICDPNIETDVSLETDNPRHSKDYEPSERYNIVKSRSEVLEYLKKHYPSWRDYTNDANGKIIKDNQPNQIIRTIGRNLNSLKIDKNNNLTVNGVSKMKQNEMTNLLRFVNNDREDVTNDNDANVNDYTKSIGMENNVNFDKYSGLKNNGDFGESNLTDDVIVCNNDFDNEAIHNDKLTVNDNCQNGELSNYNDNSVIIDSCQSLDESMNTYALIKLFLIHLSKTLRTIYRFLHDNVAHFRENNFSHENILILREKISKTHLYLENIIIKLKRIIDRESNETQLKVILANCSDALEDIRIIKYRNIVMKCLEQAQILQRVMKIMLHTANESNSPISSYNCDYYLNIFE